MFVMMGGLGLFLAMGIRGTAQTTGTPLGATSSASDQVVSLQEFTVTGSHIPTTETAATARAYPVLTINQTMIEKTDFENTAELLQSMPVFNEGAVPISNGDTGFAHAAAGISLHGLGVDATLVLVDDHRVAAFPVGQLGDRSFVDLNSLPPSFFWDGYDTGLVGDSVVDGADAVAGVVNIHLLKDYKGSAIHLEYQNTTDKDASQLTADMHAGASNGTISLMVGFNYQNQNSISDADRDYTLVPAFLSSSSDPINAQVAITSYNVALGLATNHARPAGVTKNVFFVTPGITPVPGGNSPSGNTLSPTGLAVSPSTNFGSTPASEYIPNNTAQSVYDYNQTAWSLPSWKRDGLVLNGEIKLFGTQNIKAYFDGSYQDSETEYQQAPAPTLNFSTPGQTSIVIPANSTNPFLFSVSAKTATTLTGAAQGSFTIASGSVAGPGTIDVNGTAQRAAPAGAYNPFNPFNQDISGSSSYRLADFGNRILDDTTESALATAGIRGDHILDKYDFDAGVRYNEVTYRTNDTEVSASKFNQILNANSPIFNPTSSSYIGTTIPYNPFGYYTNSINNPLLIQYATIHVHDTDTSSLGNGYLTIGTTDLLDLPAGNAGASAGLEYRVETLNQSPDAESAAGDVIGEVQESPLDRSRQVGSAFVEMDIPIIGPRQQITGVHRFTLHIEGRYEDFLTGHQDSAVPEANILYQPFNDSFALRASAGRGFLAPSMEKLYSPGIENLGTVILPTTGKPTSQIPFIDTGNSHLQPETSDTYSAGFVWTPNFTPLKGFTMNLDLWRIDRNGTALVNSQNTVNDYNNPGFGFNGPGNLPGENVILDPTTGNIVEVVSVYHNAGESIAEGADIDASYMFKTDSFGRFEYSVMFEDLHSFRQASFPGQPLQEMVDKSPLVTNGEDAYLRRRATTTMDWIYHNFDVTVSGRFLDGFQDFDLNDNPRRVGSSWIWDLRLGYTFNNGFGPYLGGTTIAVGSLNILDRHPPLELDAGANSNNYPGTLYTSFDQRIYVSLDKKF